ncbi:hypothetical protein [Qipengyuania oceanensis]|uniref:DUF2550 family protein n=1 Tax=Qipengyuania oceanensis TaxID=1463597 RepID=A0A844YIH3_9SPHN|nr:hypothetical protein [Qipengyuania oceanensis]MXO63682.1 hypothetical protein [Qipengyuania oceanensis]
MSLGTALLILLAAAMLVALALLAWMVRTVMREAHSIEDDDAELSERRRSFFGWLNPVAWWRRDETVHLFYQRDAKGRYRKIRRH